MKFSKEKKGLRKTFPISSQILIVNVTLGYELINLFKHPILTWKSKDKKSALSQAGFLHQVILDDALLDGGSQNLWALEYVAAELSCPRD